MFAKEEIVIIMNHKIRAKPLDIWKMVKLIYEGYGLVCMRNFYFYGFKKDLIRKIGFFDERYIGDIERIMIIFYECMKQTLDITKSGQSIVKILNLVGIKNILPDLIG